MSFPLSLRRLPSPALSSGSGAVAVLPLRAAPPATAPTWAAFTRAASTRAASTRTAPPKPSSSLAGRQPAKCLATQTPPKPPPRDLAPICFNSTVPRFNTPSGLNPREPDGERKVKLGKTLRILQDRLPSLLQSPLPQDILAPNISLHLFPSTHPYLPAVSGRVAYVAALWTSPIAWNRVPIIGNLKLEVLSERMTTQPLYFSPRREGAYGEQLVVKWRLADKHKAKANPSLAEQGEHKLDNALSGTPSPREKGGFTGLFIFEFDKEGRIISHTIEHVDQTGDWESGMGAKVVHLTDWLLGNIRGRTPQGACHMMHRTVSQRVMQQRRDPRLR